MTISFLPDLSKAQRVLIIRLGAIGDVVHALPVASALAEAHPHLELIWAVEEMSADVLRGNPHLKEVIALPRDRWKQGRYTSPQVWREYLELLSGLRKRRFDVTLDLHGYAKSAAIAYATGAPYRLGWWNQRDGAGLVSRSIPRRPESWHRVDCYLDVIRALGVEPQRLRFPLAIPEAARQEADTLLCDADITPQEPFAVINPATSDLTRRWGAERYAELCVLLAERLHLPCVLIGSRKEMPLCEEVIAHAQARAGSRSYNNGGTRKGETGLVPVSLAGQTNLKQLFALLDRCAVHICGDTGSTHIAAALGCPTVALHGPTDPAFAGPWGQAENVISRYPQCRAECAASDCVYRFKKNRRATARNLAANLPPGRCLTAISAEEVLRVVESLSPSGPGVENPGTDAFSVREDGGPQAIQTRFL